MVVLATTNQIDRVAMHLRSPGKFEKEVEVPVPSPGERLEVCVCVQCMLSLWKMCSGVKNQSLLQILRVLLRKKAHQLSRDQLKR